MSHTVDTTNDGIATGLVYSFKWRSYNVIGYSDYSDNLLASVNDKPAQPLPPTVNYAYSDKTSLFIQWTKVSDGIGIGGLIKGYQLFMDDGEGGNF
jgi:hypothetical protein